MKCFYHGIDLDGKCSGAIVKRVYPQCEMIPIDYGDKFPWDKIVKGEIVFMVDFSLEPYEDMLKLNDVCDLVWIDHHISAIKHDLENKQSKIKGVRSTAMAGCGLTWGYFFQEDMPRWVHLLDRYDVWDHSDPQVLPFQYGMRLLRNDPYSPVWLALFDDTRGEYLLHIALKGETALQYQEMLDAENAKELAFETKFMGYRAIAMNQGKGSSSLVSVYDPLEHDLMIVFKWKKTFWLVSLYTTHSHIDVSDLASVYGGGGHAGSAGFQCLTLPFDLGEYRMGCMHANR